MKKYLFALIPIVFLLLNGCSDSDAIVDDPGGDFDLTIAAIALPASQIPFQVVYNATATGDGKITKIDYYDGNGTSKTVTNPSLPWSTTVTMNGGKSVYMYAKGNASTGRVDITCTATAGSLVITYGQFVARN